jgi:hypothetical protein
LGYVRVKLAADQKHGDVFGRLVWRGLPKEKDEKITSALKKEWKLVGFPDYDSFHNTPADIESQIPKATVRTV